MSVGGSKPLLSGAASGTLRIASVGECMVEMAPTAQTGQFQQSFAGDTFNVLWYLRQLKPDWSARYISRVGDDQISDDMLAMMRGAGVETDHIGRDGERTIGLYVISVQDGERSFAYWRGQSAARHLIDDPMQIEAGLRDTDVVFFSGITLAILDARSRAVLLEILARQRRAGKTIAFDPNLRSRLWPNAADMRKSIVAGAAISHIVLPSFDEEAEHSGDTDPEATIARYLSVGAGTVVVKNGAGAVHYVHQGRSGTVMPDPVPEIVDTTSAGDSFNAGLLAGLGHVAPMEDVIRFASGVAAQVIGQKGALGTIDRGALHLC